MLKSETKDIDGLTFEVTQLSGFKALKMFRKLGSALGPALGELAQGFGEKVDIDAPLEMRRMLPALGAAIPKLFSNVSEADLESITRGLLETTLVLNPENGKTSQLLPQFDVLMQGKVGTVFKLLAFAIQVNFGSFFSVAAEFARPHLAAKKATSEASLPT